MIAGRLLLQWWTTQSTSRRSAWVVFDPVSVPNGATITSATLDFTSINNAAAIFEWANGFPGIKWSAPAPSDGAYISSGTIYGEDIDDASAYSTVAAINAATRTTASTAWSEGGNMSSGTWTPDHAAGSNLSYTVTSIVQEIVNRAGWASGNAMQFFIDESGSSFANYPTQPTYWCFSNLSAASDPALNISYT